MIEKSNGNEKDQKCHNTGSVWAWEHNLCVTSKSITEKLNTQKISNSAQRSLTKNILGVQS